MEIEKESTIFHSSDLTQHTRCVWSDN